MPNTLLPAPSSEVIRQQLADGTVLFHTATELYFGLNEVGGHVWELLPPACATMDEMLDKLAQIYPDAPRDVVRQDVAELLADLVEQGLVVATPLSNG
jgi:hypothetical protein